jgi:glycine/D-amino acid oxidase-like deaminating enzyme/nitrite reductase/ring-hydroxylating ferredoxin subunit
MTESLWLATAERPSFAPLDRDGVHVDVAIVGAGITGLTAATLLKLAGRRVAVIEARRVGSGVTGRTTAHATEVLDTRYQTLESRFGREGSALAAKSSRAAIEQIAALDAKLFLKADFERLPGYLYTERQDHVEALERELEAARRAGVRAAFAPVPLPIATRLGIRFEDQAQFHPLRYVGSLAERVAGEGCSVFEDSRVLTVEEAEPCRLELERGMNLSADRVIIATHAPINRLLLQTKLAHYRSYVISGPARHAVRGLFWDTEEPYHYVRSYRNGDETELLVGGEDHKTGQEEDTEAPFARLADHAKRCGLNAVTHRWSAQVIEPVDGLPFIGRNAASERVYVATGYSGNGMTFGTLAGMILSDACLGVANPFAELYAATRIKPLASLRSFLSENIDFPVHLVSDTLWPANGGTVAEIAPGDGRIVRVAEETLAVHRDDRGQLHAVSPSCTHLGCHVAFNHAEKTWDCPCHGSRFGVDGEVLDGPAVLPLAIREVSD